MNVELIALTQPVNLLQLNNQSTLISQVARCSTDRMEIEKTESDLYKSVETLWKRKHNTPFEFIHFAFLIRDVSRSLTHQLVRHRLCSFVQQSQRYVKYTEDSDVWDKMILPLDVLMSKRDDMKNEIKKIFSEAKQAYQNLIKMGLSNDDARCVLPNAMPSTICMSFNLRHFLEVIYPLRSDRKASREIRVLMNKLMHSFIYLYRFHQTDNVMYQFLVYYLKSITELRGYDDVFSDITEGRV